MFPGPLVEHWRPIPGFLYEVSSFGRVRHCRKLLVMKHQIVSGYPRLSLCSNGKVFNATIHTLVCTAFNGPKPTPQHEVAHWDGNKANNFYGNLRWATRPENGADAIRLGRVRFGENHAAAKLTNEQVVEIRRRYAAGGISQRPLAAEYGVSQPVISKVIRGEKYTQ